MSQFVTAMRLFDCDANDKRKICKAKIEVQKSRLVLKPEQRFSLERTTFFEQGFVDENALLNTPQKRRGLKKRDRRSSQKGKHFDLGDLGVVPTSKLAPG